MSKPARGVTSGHPLATAAGCEALDRGGSAVDAALAAAFTQWVVSPTVCGPGGDLFVLHIGNGTATVHGGWARVPSVLDTSEDVPFSGPRSVVVPGALVGAESAWRSAGRLAWADLFSAALEHADGHPVTPWMQRSYAEVVAKGHGHAIPKVLDTDQPPAAGEQVSCRRLGRSLAEIALEGAAAFYSGDLALAIVASARASGVGVTADDLAAQTAVTAPAVTVDLGDCTVTVPGSPSQATIIPELLEAVDSDLSPVSRDFCEAVAPITERMLVDRCVVGLPGTAVSSAALGEEMAIVVHSLAGVQFGSAWVAGETGIAFGNRVGTALTTRADLPASHPVAGAIIPHTLSAAYFTGPHGSMLVATPGGDRQVQWVAQAGQRFRSGASLDEVIEGPRWFVCPEGNRFGVPGGIGQEWFLFAEPGVEWADDKALAGYTVRAVPWVGGGMQGISRDSTGTRFASDPRGGGTATNCENDTKSNETGDIDV